MNSNDDSPIDFYNKVFDSYKSEDYFDETTITINYTKNIVSTDKSERLYKIDSLSLESSQSDNSNDNLKKFINTCNDNLKKNIYSDEWQLFYLYKELFQFFISARGRCNYFRGQSHNYPLVPGILRKNIQNSYRKDFENLYLKIANEFPEKITYFELKSSNNIEDREYQLSLLQHYGFKTSLLDITSNPYIAMLFMLSEQFTEYKEPAFFLFQVDENLHRNKHLFTEVRKSKLNERIIAQKGAFLNFDKIFSNKAFDIERILSIKIVLHFSDKKYLDYIASEKEKLSQIELAESSKIDNGQSDYFALLEKEIEQSKIECLRFIKDELSQKLREYYFLKKNFFRILKNGFNICQINMNQAGVKRYHYKYDIFFLYFCSRCGLCIVTEIYL